MPRILVQRIHEPITRIEPTDLHENILISVPVQVPERHPMPLLQMPESARKCYIFKAFASIVPVHGIWSNGVV